MKKFFLILTAVFSLTFSGLLATSCQYDDTDIWNEIDQVKNELKELKSQVDAMQSVVKKLSENKGIVSFDKDDTGKGYLLEFTDGSKILLTHGEPGADGSKIGVKEESGIYYWTVDGEFLLADGEKVAVTGHDGHTPVLSIDADGFWCVDGNRILVDEKPVPAQGDSFFKKVESKDGKVIFTLGDGSEYIVPMSSGARFLFKDNCTHVSAAKTVLSYIAEGLSFVELETVPAGVDAVLDEKDKTVTIRLTDESAFVAGKRLILKSADQNGYAMFASIKLLGNCTTADFLMINEGWFGHEGGTINAYYDGTWELRAYQKANLGKSFGNTSSVCVQNGDKTYVITKEAPHVVEVNTKDLKYLSELTFEGNAQANNIALGDDKKAYVATSGGIFEISLNPLALTKKIVDKNAGDIVATSDKIFFISGKKAYMLNIADNEVTALCDASTGLVKDGTFLYVGGNKKIHQFSLSDGKAGEVYALENELYMNPWAYTPSSMNISEDGRYIYFATQDKSQYAVKKISLADKKCSTIFVLPEGREFYGSAMSLNPKNDKVHIINKKAGWGDSFLDVVIEVVDGKTSQQLDSIVYTSFGNTYWFPSKIFFLQ